MNPYKIKNDGEIRVVLSSHAWGGIAWAIRARTKSHWNHVMWMIRPGEFATQGLFFTSVPFDKYFKPGVEIEVWRLKNLLNEEHIKLLRHVIERLRLPKRKTRYDFLGIFGHLIGIRKLNNPWRNYCSEDVAETLGKLFYVTTDPKSSPGDLRDVFIKYKCFFECEGRWRAPKI